MAAAAVGRESSTLAVFHRERGALSTPQVDLFLGLHIEDGCSAVEPALKFDVDQRLEFVAAARVVLHEELVSRGVLSASVGSLERASRALLSTL
jgi:hypothetical protein